MLEQSENTSAYRKVFSDYQQGYLQAIHLLRHPADLKLSPVLSDDSMLKLKDILAKTAKRQTVSVALVGQSAHNQALLINHIAHALKQTIAVVDCLLLTSKYIGETEKNLAHIMAEAESQNLVLLFDEADALFGKRTEVSGANDKYANQEVSYIFKLLGQSSGLSLLSVNNTPRLSLLKTRVNYVL
jgi:SpoVK/Ycf46/Vps4 family AAA+-type ATPase